MPVLWGKFQLANHASDEPIISFTQLAKENNISQVASVIGEVVYLEMEDQEFSQWWKILLDN